MGFEDSLRPHERNTHSVEQEATGENGARKDIAVPDYLILQPLEGGVPYTGVANPINHERISRKQYRRLMVPLSGGGVMNHG